ncbi:MAG: GNAT family N-acetyltransferase [Chloroflexi bacterium]|nr:GNAT family N-acetyltransferase [Chloroflexota bacterium]
MRLIRLDWPTTARARAAWEQLRQAAPTETLFLTPEWLESWWRTLGSGTRPLLFGVAEEDQVAALAPLGRARLGVSPFTVLRPLGVGVSDYLDLLLPPQPERRRRALGTLLDGLLLAGTGWDAIDLPGLPAESPTVHDLTVLAREYGLSCAVLPGHARPAIALDGTYENFLKTRPGRFRYNLRSRLRRLGERGEVRFRTVERPEDVRAALATLVALHAKRWDGQYTSTLFSSSERGRRFYVDALPRYAARGLLDLTLLECGGVAVAGSIGFVDRDTYSYYLPAWDPELAALAPSSLLLAHLVERAYARGLHRFDFMLGDEPYKARWVTEERQTVRLVLAAPGLRGQAAFAALVGWQRVRQRARSSTLLQRARRHWLGRARSAVTTLPLLTGRG